ncbi:osmoprotectant ABC transporter substrate-binding protein [Enterococcus camelliae]|uniref:Osmoprotectant ABC transporter substrate-binding protein n=1 Tax=Enterococcus camelliae TaxID=453959 RepID=A0ABW5TIV9_9ENTE
MKKRYFLSFIFLSLFVLLTGCSLPGLSSSDSDDTITITGGITSESQILASLVAGMIEHYTDNKVTIINNLATTTINHQAMMNGDAQISAARYTGTDLTTTLGLAPVKDPTEAYNIVSREFEKKYNQTWLKPYGFDNTYVYLVTKATAEKYHLSKISDLKKVAGQLSAGVDPAWITREGDGYDGFKKAYGFEFKTILPMQIGLVYDAVAAGKMDIVLGYSTDGRIGSYDLVMLEDDKKFFPPYDAVPIIDNKLLKKQPKLQEVIDKLADKISTDEMQKLNFEADNNLIEPSVVAKQFLEKNNYFKGE